MQHAWKHSFRDKISSSHGSKCILTGTSRVSYGSSEQIPDACLKAKSPRAPEQLTSPCLFAPAQHSFTGLWSMQTRMYQTRYKGKHDTGAPCVTRTLYVVKVSVAYLQQKPFPAGQGINRFVHSSVDTLTASWVMSFFLTVKCEYSC